MPAKTADASAALDHEIVGERVFDAPRELVFRMWTDPEHVAQWWGPKGFTNTIQEMDVRRGGVWQFIMHGPDGRDYQNKNVYVEVVRPERIVFDHVSGPIFRATATFEEENGKTKVTMRMRFETAELRNKVAEEFGAVEGLQQTLGRLAEKLAATDPAEFRISRVVDAPRDVVFQAWTDEKHLEQWWGPKGCQIFSCKNDLRVGGTMHYGMRMPNGDELWGIWVYREIAPPERLAFVNSFATPAAEIVRPPFPGRWPVEMLTTVTLTDAGGGKTKVAVQSVPTNATEEERCTFEHAHGSLRHGWGGTLDQLASHLSSR